MVMVITLTPPVCRWICQTHSYLAGLTIVSSQYSISNNLTRGPSPLQTSLTLPVSFVSICQVIQSVTSLLAAPIGWHRIIMLCNSGANSPSTQNTMTPTVKRQSARMSKITNDSLTRSGTVFFIAVPIWQQ